MISKLKEILSGFFMDEVDERIHKEDPDTNFHPVGVYCSKCDKDWIQMTILERKEEPFEFTCPYCKSTTDDYSIATDDKGEENWTEEDHISLIEASRSDNRYVSWYCFACKMHVAIIIDNNTKDDELDGFSFKNPCPNCGHVRVESDIPKFTMTTEDSEDETEKA